MSVASRIQAIQEHIGDVYDTLDYAIDTTSENKNIVNISKNIYNGYLDILKDNGETLFNNLPKVTGEGTSVILNDTANSKMKIELEPSELEQETTTGKNLLDGANPTEYLLATSTFVDDIIKVSSTNTITLPQARWTIDDLKVNDIIRYSGIIQDKNGQIVVQYDNNGTWTSLYDMTSEYTDGITPSIKGYTNTNGYSKFRVLLYSSKTTPTGASESSYKNVIVTVNNSDMTYEPYTNGASPNPDYPQEIHTISGDNTIKISNSDNTQEQTLPLNLPVKNLWNSNFERAEYDASGNKVTTLVWLVNETKLSVKPNTTYTISQKETPSQYRISYFNGNTYLTQIQNTQNTTTGYKSYTFTTPYNCDGIYVQFRSTLEKIASGTYNMAVGDITNAQLEEGTKANSYTPYGTTPLEVCKIGDYEDEFVYNETDTTLELNKWYLKKNIGKVVLDGSENWEEYKGGHAEGFYVYFRPFTSFKMGLQTTKCTHFNNVNASWMTDLNKNGRYSDHQSLAYRYFVTNEYDTNTKFKEFVANEYQNNTPITLYGKLATPTYILLNDTLQTQLNNIQKALSYQDQTNISQVNNDLPFRLKLSAIQKYTE